MSAPPWRATCWGGPLDGNTVWVPARVDGMPYGWVKIEHIQISDPDPSQQLPHEDVLIEENQLGFYMRDDRLHTHPSGPLVYRWHDTQVSLRATTSSEGGA